MKSRTLARVASSSSSTWMANLVIAAVSRIGVVALVTLQLFLNDASRLLGRGRTVEKDERPAVGEGPVKIGNLCLKTLDVDRFTRRGVLGHKSL